MNKEKIRKIALGVIGVCVVLIIFISLIGRDEPSSQTASSTPQETWHTGDDVLLKNESGSSIFIAPTQESYDKMFNLIIAKDEVGITQMVMNKEIFLVVSGTKAKIIGRTFASREVRIMEGEYNGQSGWLPVEMLSR
jgi:hypothetical protein